MKDTKIFLFVHILAVCLIFVSSCEHANPVVPPQEDQLIEEKEYLYGLMTDVYYWYNSVPSVDPLSCDNIETYFNALLSSEDMTRHGTPWSWMADGQYWNNAKTGLATTYGMSLGQAIDHYKDYSIRVRYVFPGSPMADHGIKRGYELTHLNDIEIMLLIDSESGTIPQLNETTNKFTFKDHNGISFSFSASQKLINTRSYLASMVFTPKDYKGLPHNVGYFNYYTFNVNMVTDIHEAIYSFNAVGIKTLILDMRYNGGGDTNAMDTLANYLAPKSAEGKILAKRKHNSKYSELDDRDVTISKVKRRSNALDLERLIVLTSGASASASEVLINGLTPLMEVVQIGMTTYGKPNGMYVYPYPEGDLNNPRFIPDYIFLPICFFTVNSEGYGNFTDGLEPLNQRPDDLYHDFGLQDDWVKAALQYICTGTFPALPESKEITKASGSHYHIKTPEDRADYGIYTAMPL